MCNDDKSYNKNVSSDDNSDWNTDTDINWSNLFLADASYTSNTLSTKKEHDTSLDTIQEIIDTKWDLNSLMSNLLKPLTVYIEDYKPKIILTTYI